MQWSGELGYGVRAPEGGQSGRRDDAATGTKPLREVLEAHLLDQDIPFEHRGMRGRAWRARVSAERNGPRCSEPGSTGELAGRGERKHLRPREEAGR